MDYIIFGLGVGATLTLVGWAFREWGSALRDRSTSGDEAVLSGYELVQQMAWQRFCRSCGAVLAIFGLLVLLATIIATALMLSNTTGATIVLSTLAACMGGTLVWLGLFLHRFGSRGILRPKSAKPSSALPESTGDIDDIPGHAEAPAPLVGPPVPGVGTSIAADHPRPPAAIVPEEDEPSADVGPSDDDQAAIEEETAEPVEDALAGGRARAEDTSVDDAPLLAGSESDDDDVADGLAGDDEPIRAADASDMPEPASGRRRIVMVPARVVDKDGQPAQDAAEPDTAASSDAALADEGTDGSALEPSPPNGANPGPDPEGDDERPEGADVSPSSGRADAVRKLRQRRIQRQTRDSSAPK